MAKAEGAYKVQPGESGEKVNPARVGEAAGEAAAQSGASKAETRAETRQAADAAGNYRLADDQLDAIADRTIERLEARGAFEPAPAPDMSNPEPEQPPGERDAAASSGEGPPPRKYKPAEKFMGRHKQGAS